MAPQSGLEVLPLKLNDVQGHFFVWGIGCFVSIMLLAAEVLAAKYKSRKERIKENKISKFRD
jgi:hypothetical protein